MKVNRGKRLTFINLFLSIAIERFRFWYSIEACGDISYAEIQVIYQGAVFDKGLQGCLR